MNRKDFVPESSANFNDWTSNLHDHAEEQLTGITGWDAARITAFKARLATLRDKSKAVLDAQAIVDSLTGEFLAAKAAALPGIRQDCTNIKTSAGYDDGVGTVLDILTSSASFDSAGYKPTIASITSLPGHNRIMIKKRGVDSINIYWRRKGEAAWRLLAAKRVRFPVEDDTPPASPTQSEGREYRCTGVLGDDEIGQPSDIAEAIFTP